MVNFTDKYLDILNNIEHGLKVIYEFNEELTDIKMVFALDNAIIAIKKEYGYARNEKVIEDLDTKNVIDHCVVLGRERIDETKQITLKDYVKCLEKVKKSVKLHSSDGRRGYYEFVRNYV